MSFFSQLLVLECASVLAGPAVGAFFAELGATVIKLEPLTGDVTRSWKLPTEPSDHTVSAYFSCVNWGKHSLSVDLKQPEGLEIARALAQKADVLIANYKPGAAERLGMDYASLAPHNSGLIYAHLTGYGDQDARTGYDALIQAESGFLYLNARPGEQPVRIPVALMDLLAAHQLKEAVLVSLIERISHGRGDYIEVSLMQSALASLANQASNWLVAGEDPEPLGLEHPNITPYGNLYTCADGRELMLAIGSNAQFRALVQLLGAPQLAEDPRFENNLARVRAREALQIELTGLFATQQSEDLLPQFWQAGIPAGRVQKVSEALATPSAQGLLLQQDGFKGLRTRAFSSSLPVPELRSPPALGADTDRVLQVWLDFDKTHCETLRKQGVVV